MSLFGDAQLEALLAELHAQNDRQAEAMKVDAAERVKELPAPGPERDAAVKLYLSDKMVALDRDKAAFCHLTCRAVGARRIVEIGTSYGVSTLYLAAAVRKTLREQGGEGVVIGTEYEPRKAEVARGHYARAGLADLIELREGDLRETLKTLAGPIDFVLMDIWTPMSRPAIELVHPHLRPGAVVICDNTVQARAGYDDYFGFINDPANGFTTLTLPFEGGLEMSVLSQPRGQRP